MEPEDDVQPRYQFKILRSYFIGSRLRADVLDWPQAFHYHDYDVPPTTRLCDDPDCRYSPTVHNKRQVLYALLQLTQHEQVSLDKWDLFPHRRANNRLWLEMYSRRTELIAQLTERCKITLPWEPGSAETMRDPVGNDKTARPAPHTPQLAESRGPAVRGPMEPRETVSSTPITQSANAANSAEVKVPVVARGEPKEPLAGPTDHVVRRPHSTPSLREADHWQHQKCESPSEGKYAFWLTSQKSANKATVGKDRSKDETLDRVTTSP